MPTTDWQNTFFISRRFLSCVQLNRSQVAEKSKTVKLIHLGISRETVVPLKPQMSIMILSLPHRQYVLNVERQTAGKQILQVEVAEPPNYWLHQPRA